MRVEAGGALSSGLIRSLLVELFGDHGFVEAILGEHLLQSLLVLLAVLGGAIEHMLLVAETLLLGLIVAGEVGAVLELLQTPIRAGIPDRAWIRWLTIGGEHVVTFYLLTMFK